MTQSTGRNLLRAVVVIFIFAAFLAPSFGAEQKRIPVPAVTIYPGDEIKAEMLEEQVFTVDTPAMAKVIDTPKALIGFVARRTLLVGQPIAANAIDQPRLVTRGVTVKVIVEDDGMVIVAYGSPLQSGGVGALIRVRNIDTGVIVVGTVQADGTVRIRNG